MGLDGGNNMCDEFEQDAADFLFSNFILLFRFVEIAMEKTNLF